MPTFASRKHFNLESKSYVGGNLFYWRGKNQGKEYLAHSELKIGPNVGADNTRILAAIAKRVRKALKRI